MSETTTVVRDCAPMRTDAPLDSNGQYPPEMVVGGPDGFAGECREATNYVSADGHFAVRLWESRAGVLQTDDYPFDEYFIVLEGRVIITNRQTGVRLELGPGESGMLTKHGDFTWDMPGHFLKQYVRVE
ncbi:cupin domain-containing protein [Pseudonocardia spinosispora]|uniref:cupin domain-containing protein n=1 Tax=Pseudonocardia spinosispora TaxID=103441 RepID=UPI0004270EB9|nr:cupin domain-containing protein [Pseudonocardia spinosispora]